MVRTWLVWVSLSVVLASVLASMNSMMFGVGLTPWISGLSLILGLMVSGGFSFETTKKSADKFWHGLNAYEKYFFIFIFVGGLFSLVNLYSSPSGGVSTANPNNLGDLPFHLHLIQFFSRGGLFPPENPIFSGVRLSYPYGVDLFDALFVNLGTPETAAIFLTGSCALLASTVMLFRMGGIFLAAAFFFSGGVAMTQGQTWAQSFGPESSLAWKNLFLAVFETQRGFLFALPAGLFLIQKWNKFLRESDYYLELNTIWIWAVLPFFHLHTFFILSLWMFLSNLKARKFQISMIAGGLLASFFVLRSIGVANVQSAIGFEPFWNLKTLSAWIINFSSWIMLPFYLSFLWLKRRDFHQLFVAWALTGFVLMVRLAPYSWDQIKVLVWVYLLWSLWFFNEFVTSTARAVLFAAILFWPGFLQWQAGLPSRVHRFEVQSAQDRACVRELIKDLKPNQVVASVINYDNPLLGLGQSLYLGYPGHVWTHGLPLAERQQHLNLLLQGKSDATAQSQAAVNWIVFKNQNLMPVGVDLKQLKSFGWTEKKQVGDWALWSRL